MTANYININLIYSDDHSPNAVLLPTFKIGSLSHHVNPDISNQVNASVTHYQYRLKNFLIDFLQFMADGAGYVLKFKILFYVFYLLLLR